MKSNALHPDPASQVICATSAWNGLGFTPHQIWALRRADVTAFIESPFRCTNGKRATMAQIRTLPPTAWGADRMQPIVSRLLEQLGPALSHFTPPSKVSLSLSLPERMSERDGVFAAQRARLERGAMDWMKGHGLKGRLTVEARGHASLAFALTHALMALERGDVVGAILGGVDTSYDPCWVDRLSEEGRLFDGENLQSAIFGEGGAFFVLTRPDFAKRNRLPQLGFFGAVCTDHEPAGQTNDLPSVAEGLSRAAVGATELLRRQRRSLDWWLSDMTAESYRVHEFQLAWPRAAAGAMTETSTLDFLSTHLGDLGAATMPTGVAVATEGFLRGSPAARTCLITASSTAEDRGAILLESLSPSRRGLG